MGDVRYDAAYERVAHAADRAAALRELDTSEVLMALAGAARRTDPYLADVLATEALNRYRRLAALFVAFTWGAGLVVAARTLLAFATAALPFNVPDEAYLVASLAVLLVGGVVAATMWYRCREAIRRVRAS